MRDFFLEADWLFCEWRRTNHRQTGKEMFIFLIGSSQSADSELPPVVLVAYWSGGKEWREEERVGLEVGGA